MGKLSGRYQGRVRRLMELSGERRAGPTGLIYGETVSLRTRAMRFLLWFGATVGVIGLAAWWLFPDQGCNDVLLATEFAGTSERFFDRYSTGSSCDVATMRSIIWRDFLFAAIYTSALALLLTVWWNASWDTEPGFSRVKGTAFAGIALGAFVAEAIENITTLVGLHTVDGSPALRFARIIFTVAWVKWLLIALLVVATVAIFLVWLIRSAAVLYRLARGSDEVNHLPTIVKWEPDEQQPNLGICLSGGGIRSAAFSLGAMSALEETSTGADRPGHPPGILGQADLLASVSGGGYAASSWRLAVGNGDDAIVDRPVIGDPNCHTGDGAAAVAGGSDDDLFPRLRDYREYIRNGRGGLLLSAVIVVAQMVWHLFLTLAVIAILAWPIGRLIDSWVITTGFDSAGERIIEYRRLASPAIGLLLVLGVILVVRSFTHRGKLRDGLNAASLALMGLAAMLFVGLVAIPWMVDWLLPEIDSLLPGATGANSALATFLGGSIVASVLRMLQAPIQSRAQYLGGVLLAVGLLWFSLVVASHAASEGRLFTFGWTEWVIAVVGYTVLLVVTNPDLWSLHWIYRRRLSQSFANRWDAEAGEWQTLGTGAQPTLSSYDGAPGPKQVICAVAARGDVTNTGIPVLSMTFEPDFVAIHCGPDPANRRASLSHAIATKEYENLFHGRVFASRYRTVFCAAALSAAAVAPSLGRHNLGTTNTLIAALNLRLGVWMPNPMFRRGRRAGPDLFNMFKELSGSYDLADPNLYVTDGGHWENLALVELIRRKTRRIISVDASGDKNHSFAALHEAIELAQLECATKISFVDGDLEAMRPGDQPKPEKNWCRAEILYPDGSTGRLLYVKAQASEQMPLDILRYSKEDPTFPNYSTADQLLKEPEFCNLAILGRESMIAALADHSAWLFEGGADTAGSGGVVSAVVEPVPAEPASVDFEVAASVMEPDVVEPAVAAGVAESDLPEPDPEPEPAIVGTGGLEAGPGWQSGSESQSGSGLESGGGYEPVVDVIALPKRRSTPFTTTE